MSKLLTTLAVAATFVAGCNASTPAADDTTEADVRTDVSEPTPEPEPVADDPEPEPLNPDGDIEGYCDYLLDFDQGHTFAASIDAVNTGNVGIVVRVAAEFDQIGDEPVRIRKKVRVPVGDTRTVQLERDASDDEIDRHQSAGSECDITGEIVDFFGGPAGDASGPQATMDEIAEAREQCRDDARAETGTLSADRAAACDRLRQSEYETALEAAQAE